MKRCPKCQRTYPDDSPGFCVNDGAQLVSEEVQAYDPQKTMLAAPPPPPQYQAQNAPPESAPPPQWQQQQPQPQANWPPPPPGQNWGAYYPQPGQAPAGYAPQQYGAPPPAAGGKGLSLTSFIIGLISFAAVVLIFLMAQRIVDPDRDVIEICFWGSAGTGLIAIVLGLLALISRRQRSKWMAILGLVLGIPAILFFAYVLIRYNSI